MGCGLNASVVIVTSCGSRVFVVQFFNQVVSVAPDIGIDETLQPTVNIEPSFEVLSYLQVSMGVGQEDMVLALGE